MVAIACYSVHMLKTERFHKTEVLLILLDSRLCTILAGWIIVAQKSGGEDGVDGSGSIITAILRNGNDGTGDKSDGTGNNDGNQSVQGSDLFSVRDRYALLPSFSIEPSL